MSLELDAAAQDLLFREARTANTFSSDPVSDETLQAVYDLVKYAPTSMNQQPLRIVLIRTDDARERLVKTMYGPNGAKVAQAPLVAILAADLEFHELMPRVFPHFPEAKDMFADPAIREASAIQNGTLQAAYFLLGIRAAGLNAGPMIGFDAEAVNREFFPDGKQKVLLVMNIGKPGENAWWPRSPRLEYDEVVSAA
ncbi:MULTISPECIES: malonic semialdehyde reductase [Lentzea]|uniref:3-hydroxypropanoate dehydrogenase n=1 Tax=Lentzea albida TaxID=65499 RepID=A0A1H9UY49_9PSEU|nr:MULTISPECIES: malonic semialdehyde reductase [Lentzea]USX48331.1 malonic semialdehyde reductase [Lentzea sp. HUAS12]SES14268.1 3-hydroxypropanoate dehydrogenase [Lentzea albida]